MLWTVVAPVSFAAELISGGAANDFLILCYIFSDGVGGLCCRLEGVPIPRPVQWVVVAAITLDRYWCISGITAALDNVLQVSSLPFEVLLNHLDYHGSHFVGIVLQSTG